MNDQKQTVRNVAKEALSKCKNNKEKYKIKVFLQSKDLLSAFNSYASCPKI